MLSSLILAVASAQGQGFTFDGAPALEHTEPVSLTYKIRVSEISLPIGWFDIEKVQAVSEWKQAEEGGWEVEYQPVGSNVLVLDPLLVDQTLSEFAALDFPQRRRLPLDGTLVLCLDEKTQVLHLQMGFQFAVDEKNRHLFREYNYSWLEEPPSQSAIHEGRLVEVAAREGEFPAWSMWYISQKLKEGEPRPIQSPRQATPGHLTVRLQEAEASGSIGWRGLFESRKDENRAGSYLCVAESLDKSHTWFWFEEEPRANAGSSGEE